MLVFASLTVDIDTVEASLRLVDNSLAGHITAAHISPKNYQDEPGSFTPSALNVTVNGHSSDLLHI